MSVTIDLHCKRSGVSFQTSDHAQGKGPVSPNHSPRNGNLNREFGCCASIVAIGPPRARLVGEPDGTLSTRARTMSSFAPRKNSLSRSERRQKHGVVPGQALRATRLRLSRRLAQFDSRESHSPTRQARGGLQSLWTSGVAGQSRSPTRQARGGSRSPMGRAHGGPLTLATGFPAEFYC